MTKLEMVQQAMAVRGEVTSEEIAAFIEKWHGVRIEPKFIPIYRASIKDIPSPFQNRLLIMRPFLLEFFSPSHPTTVIV